MTISVVFSFKLQEDKEVAFEEFLKARLEETKVYLTQNKNDKIKQAKGGVLYRLTYAVAA